MNKLVDKLAQDYPNINFISGNLFYWSPKDEAVYYKADSLDIDKSSWSLFHELSHALLKHKSYTGDFELIKLEALAWDKAKKISKKYNVYIDSDHIQDCLDTYRDWLHKRSACPECSTHSLQLNASTYRCINCNNMWNVTASRFCRPYRITTSKT